MRQFSLPKGSDVPVALLEIDEEVYNKWHEPYHIPRDKLLQLIRYAVQGKSRLIVVDVDLVKAGLSKEDDQTLMAYIGSYEGDTGIIFIKQVPPDGRSRASFLDTAIDRSANTVWASAVFYKDGDSVIRRGPLWSNLITPQKNHYLISVQLSAKYFLDGSESLEDAQLRSMKDVSNRLRVPVQKIVYGIPWHLESGQAAPIVPDTNGQTPLFSRRSVLAITESEQPVNSDWLSDHVTVIGASYASERDNHTTVLGEMPGFIIIANAIHSLRSFGEIKSPPLPVLIAIMTAVVVSMSYAFTIFPSALGIVVSGMLFILALIPLSYYMLGLGLWFNFAIPLVAVQLMHLAFKLSAMVNISVFMSKDPE